MNFPQPKRNRNQNKKSLFNMFWMYALVLLSLFALFYFQDASQTKEVDWTDFEKAALAGDIDKIMVFAANGTAEGFMTPQGVKNHKFDTTDSFEGDKKIKTTIPSSDKIRERTTPGTPLWQPRGNPRSR